MKVGSYVICIDDSNFPTEFLSHFDSIIFEGKIYIIRKIFRKDDYDGIIPMDGIALFGVQGEIDIWEGDSGRMLEMEYHFKITRFAELIPLTKDDLIEEIAECLDGSIKTLITN